MDIWPNTGYSCAIPIAEDSKLFLVENPSGFELEKIVMIGGPAEEIFYRARQIILSQRRKIDLSFGNLQVFSKIGRVPPYYSSFKEPTIQTSIKETNVKCFLNKLDKQILSDYLRLLTFAAEEAPDGCLTRKKSGLLPEDYRILQIGFVRLKKFVNQL
jgi:hypothetical protein